MRASSFIVVVRVADRAVAGLRDTDVPGGGEGAGAFFALVDAGWTWAAVGREVAAPKSTIGMWCRSRVAA